MDDDVRGGIVFLDLFLFCSLSAALLCYYFLYIELFPVRYNSCTVLQGCVSRGLILFGTLDVIG